MSRKRLAVEKGIVLFHDVEKGVTPRCFETSKRKTFKSLNDAQRFYKYLLLNVTDYVYMYQVKNGRYCVEFRTTSPTLKEAIEARDAINPHFDLWKGRGLDV